MAVEKKGDWLTTSILNVSYNASVKREVNLLNASASLGKVDNSINVGFSSSLSYNGLLGLKLSLGGEESLSYSWFAANSLFIFDPAAALKDPVTKEKTNIKKDLETKKLQTLYSYEYCKSTYIYSDSDCCITSDGEILIEKTPYSLWRNAVYYLPPSIPILLGANLGFYFTPQSKAENFEKNYSIKFIKSDGVKKTSQSLNKNGNFIANESEITNNRKIKLNKCEYDSTLYLVPDNYKASDNLKDVKNFISFNSSCNEDKNEVSISLKCKVLLAIKGKDNKTLNYLSNSCSLFAVENITLKTKDQIKLDDNETITLETACDNISKKLLKVKKFFPIYVSEKLKFEKIGSDSSTISNSFEQTIDFVVDQEPEGDFSSGSINNFFSTPSDDNWAKLGIYAKSLVQHPSDSTDCTINYHYVDNENNLLSKKIQINYFLDSDITFDNKNLINLSKGSFIVQNTTNSSLKVTGSDNEKLDFNIGDYCFVGTKNENNTQNSYIRLTDIYSDDYLFHEDEQSPLLNLKEKSKNQLLQQHMIKLTGIVCTKDKETVKVNKDEKQPKTDCVIKIKKVADNKYKLITYLLDDDYINPNNQKEEIEKKKGEPYCKVIKFSSLKEINNKLIILYAKEKNKRLSIYSYRISFEPWIEVSDNKLYFYVKDEPLTLQYTNNLDYVFDLNYIPTAVVIFIYALVGFILGEKSSANIRKDINWELSKRGKNGIFFSNSKNIFIRAQRQILVGDNENEEEQKVGLKITETEIEFHGKEITMMNDSRKLVFSAHKLSAIFEKNNSICISNEKIDMSFKRNKITIDKRANKVIFKVDNNSISFKDSEIKTKVIEMNG